MKSTIGIVHLSDLHIRADQTNPIFARAEAIGGAAAAQAMECGAVIIIFTGDIAYSGQSTEYELAKTFIGNVERSLTTRSINIIATLFVPGNHDCDFSRSTGVRDALLSGTLVSMTTDIIESCTIVQTAYRSFEEAMVRPIAYETTALARIYLIDVVGTRVQIIGFNSAWMSLKKEKGGTLFAPTKFALERNENDGADVVVWLMHHPYPWFEPNQGKGLRKHIEERADVVLTGHEHDGGAYKRTYRSGVEIDYIEGGVLQEGSDSTFSSFNLIVIDLERASQRVVHFTLEGDNYTTTSREVWRPFVRNLARLTALSEHNLSFRTRLEEAGAPFTHPRISSLKLSDIFVYPDIQRLPLDGGRPTDIIRDVPGFIREHNKVILIGSEKSGKTSIAKQLCGYIASQGIATILADGTEFRPKGYTKLRSSLRELYESQYSPEVVDTILALKQEQRALILDDFHLIHLTREGRAELLRNLAGFFKTIVLLTTSDYRMDYMAQGPGASQHPIFEYAHAEILPLGHVRRHALLTQWFWLGRDRNEVDDKTIRRDIVAAENLISSVIGNNLIPSYPLSVLILLQQLETGRQHDTGAGSFGYLYQALITASLGKIAPNPHDISSRFRYLAELAWHLAHERGGKTVTRDDLRLWHHQYCERQLVPYEFKMYTDSLIRVGILLEEMGEISFRYPYIRYYFEAQYLKEHLREEAVLKIVAEAAKSLHNEKTATVMVFLAHLSSDPFVLDTMVSEARNLFSDYEEWEGAEQTKYLNSLVQGVPRLATLRASLEENRLEELQALDDHARNESTETVRIVDSETSESDDDDSTYNSEIEAVLRMNSAFKTIQIIGQILRSYPGALSGVRKVELAEACYRLGLRTIGFMFSNFESHGEEFLKGLVAHVTRLRPDATADKIIMDANAFLFALGERFSFSVIRHIAQSVGHQELAPVFKAIERVGSGRTPFRIIDLAIKLDHAHQPPSVEAIRLYEENDRNTIVTTLVRHLVWYHLYTFPTDYDTRQRLCTKLKIDDDSNLIAGRQKLLKTQR